jgi:hypothetical protein
MIGAVDKKTYWDLADTVMWICTRDEQRVAAMWDMNENDKLSLALSQMRVPRAIRSRPGPSGSNLGADWGPAAPQGDGRPSSQGLLDLGILLRKVHSGRVRMTAIRFDGTSEHQIAVPLAELNDLSFRVVPGHPVEPAGLWSRSRGILVWRAPQFLRVDVVSAWPAPNTKTAAVSVAILRHLREIMTPEAPLTKVEAQRRCLAEVTNAYPEAFKKAWAELDPSRKRARGKHGPRH